VDTDYGKHERLCGRVREAASAEHIARRLQRLEWTTGNGQRHISTLFLGAISKHQNEKDFLYAPEENFREKRRCCCEAGRNLPRTERQQRADAHGVSARDFSGPLLECPRKEVKVSHRKRSEH